MKRITVLIPVLALVAGCGEDTSAEAQTPNVAPLCTEPTSIPCDDEAFETLNLNEVEPANAPIQNSPLSGFFQSSIDATAGGFGAQPQGAYVYGRFTDSGLETVSLSDTEALDSMDWDIAFQRFRIRLNSGTSGPSCVSAARLPDTVEFATLDAVPDSAVFRQENFFTSSCEAITDGGLGGPQLVLGGYFTYTGCLQMNGSVYAIQLADGRSVKFTVSSYYEAEAQAACNNETGNFAPVGSANFVINWAFMN
ncbi:MAG: HmuY family protein [Myxococcota bacterium]